MMTGQNYNNSDVDEKPLGEVGIRQKEPRGKAARAARDVITGDFMGSSRFRRWYPFALYCEQPALFNSLEMNIYVPQDWLGVADQYIPYCPVI